MEVNVKKRGSWVFFFVPQTLWFPAMFVCSRIGESVKHPRFGRVLTTRSRTIAVATFSHMEVGGLVLEDESNIYQSQLVLVRFVTGFGIRHLKLRTVVVPVLEPADDYRVLYGLGNAIAAVRDSGMADRDSLDGFFTAAPLDQLFVLADRASGNMVTTPSDDDGPVDTDWHTGFSFPVGGPRRLFWHGAPTKVFNFASRLIFETARFADPWQNIVIV